MSNDMSRAGERVDERIVSAGGVPMLITSRLSYDGDNVPVVSVHVSTREPVRVVVTADPESDQEARIVDDPEKMMPLTSREVQQLEDALEDDMGPSVPVIESSSVKRPPTVTAVVRRYFRDHPDELVTPGHLTRYVAEARGMDSSRQSPGAVRAAIHRLMVDGVIERVSEYTALTYRYKPSV